jgi:hypothetical protein
MNNFPPSLDSVGTDAGRIILSLYVDDMIITGDDIDGFQS